MVEAIREDLEVLCSGCYVELRGKNYKEYRDNRYCYRCYEEVIVLCKED